MKISAEKLLKTSFPPVARADAEILVLGSMPGEKSLEMQQYYAHPANLFWKFMAEARGLPQNATYQERLAAMTEARVALWDVLRQCEREGSLDSDIKAHSERPGDIVGLLHNCPQIRRICFNGQKAAAAFRRHIVPHLPAGRVFEMLVLPSTSPANASQRREEKFRIWSEKVWLAAGSF